MAEYFPPDSAQFKYRELCRIIGNRIREFGFNGSRGKWHREFEHSVQFCGVRKSHHSTSEKILFVVDLSVFNRTLGEFYGAQGNEGRVFESCQWSSRPDAIASGNGNLIELTGSTDVVRMATEQFDLIRNFGLPAMDRVRTNAGAIEDLMSERPCGWVTTWTPEWLSVLAAVEKRADSLQWARDRLCEMTRDRRYRRHLTMDHVRWHFKRLAEFVDDPSIELSDEGSGTVSP